MRGSRGCRIKVGDDIFELMNETVELMDKRFENSCLL
jgi:hypothetical protein